MRHIKRAKRHFDLSCIPLFLNVASISVVWSKNSACHNSVFKMKKNQDKWNDKQNISQKYEKYGNIKTIYQTVMFCKLGKCIMYHNVGRTYRSGKRFVRPWRFVRP